MAELDGEFICSAEIPSADLTERPCYYSGAGRIKGSYVRVGDADLPMTDYEIYTYEAFRKHLHDDEKEQNSGTDTLLEFCRIPRTRREIEDYLGINTVFYVMQHYVQPLVASGKLVMTIPEKPKSRNQKFVAKEEREIF